MGQELVVVPDDSLLPLESSQVCERLWVVGEFIDASGIRMSKKGKDTRIKTENKQQKKLSKLHKIVYTMALSDFLIIYMHNLC